MRTILCLAVAAWCLGLTAAEPAAKKTPPDELERARAVAAETRQSAAADPTIKDAESPPVKAYLAEQQRRRLMRLTGLRQRVNESQSDPAKQSLAPVLQQQLAELESRPPEPVSFDSAYAYSPATGLVGYSKKVRLLENTKEGKSIIFVDGAALVLSELGTSDYASGKFFGIEKAILIGAPGPGYTFQGSKRKSFEASLVDLEAILPKSAVSGP